MKLLKKLLPIAAVASTATIVAPIVTSCGIASGSFSCNMNAGIPDKYYESKITVKPKGQFATPALAEKAYFEDVAKNPMILIDDALYDSFAKGENKVNNAVVGVDFISVSVTINKLNVGTEKTTISCKAVYQTKGSIVRDEKKTPTETKITFEYKNVPVTLKSQEGGTAFEFSPLTAIELTKDADWSIKGKAVGKQIDEDEHGKVITTMKIESIFNKDHLYITSEYPISPLELLTFYSHYFSEQEIQ